MASIVQSPRQTADALAPTVPAAGARFAPEARSAGFNRRYKAAAVGAILVVLMGVAGASFWMGRASSTGAMPGGDQPAGTAAQDVPPAAPPTAPAKAAAHPAQPAAAAPCAQCGVVESVQAVQRKGDASGVGAVAGGVVGGVLGNQVGKGDGRTAMTVLGAIGGGFAGNEVEKRAKAVTVYRVRVRTDAGEVRTFEQSQPWSVGQAVRIDGSQLRPLHRQASSAP